MDANWKHVDELTDALRNLVFSTDELGLEPIIVLNQVLEFRVRPHAVFVFRRTSSILNLLSEAFNSLRISFALDLLERPDGLIFGLTTDDEGVQRKLDLMLVLGSTLLDFFDLFLEAIQRVAVHEVIVGNRGGVVFRIIAVATLEDFGMTTWSAVEVQGLGLERVVVELVEVAAVGEGVLSPDALQTFNEFPAAAIALGMV